MAASSPLSIAIVGSGPAGMYAAQCLTEQQAFDVRVHLFDRLPTPYGLARAGVAPDHPDKKLIIDRHFTHVLHHSRVRFHGHVDVGADVLHDELVDRHDAVIYAVGAQTDSMLGIPGEGLQGCWSAREFVAWYNGHPDFRHLPFDLSCERAVVVGTGNVALDVARILTLPIETLARTDIADHALEALRHSRVREVVLLGRRDVVHAAFNNPELEELGHLNGVEIGVHRLDLLEARLTGGVPLDWVTRRKLVELHRIATRRSAEKSTRRIQFRFLSSPSRCLGLGTLDGIALASNDPEDARAAESVLDTGLVIKANGYRGRPVPGLPFDTRAAVVPHRQGRVVDGDRVLRGVYVTGWIKRGARGVIGSNKKCARETVASLLEDAAADRLRRGPGVEGVGPDALFDARTAGWVDLSGWDAIDRHERSAGRASGRPRVKTVTVEQMLHLAQVAGHPATDLAGADAWR